MPLGPFGYFLVQGKTLRRLKPTSLVASISDMRRRTCPCPLAADGRGGVRIWASAAG